MHHQVAVELCMSIYAYGLIPHPPCVHEPAMFCHVTIGWFLDSAFKPKSAAQPRVVLAPPPPLPLRGDTNVNANLYSARHKATKQESQNKKLFSDIAISAFRFDNECAQKVTVWWTQSGVCTETNLHDAGYIH